MVQILSFREAEFRSITRIYSASQSPDQETEYSLFPKGLTNFYLESFLHCTSHKRKKEKSRILEFTLTPLPTLYLGGFWLQNRIPILAELPGTSDMTTVNQLKTLRKNRHGRREATCQGTRSCLVTWAGTGTVTQNAWPTPVFLPSYPTANF